MNGAARRWGCLLLPCLLTVGQAAVAAADRGHPDMSMAAVNMMLPPAMHPQAVPLPAAARADQQQCSLSVGEPAVNYGVFTAGQLERLENGFLGLPARTVPLSVICPSPRRMAIRLSAAQTVDGHPGFSQAGMVTIGLSSARLDGVNAEMSASHGRSRGAPAVAFLVGDTVVFDGAGGPSGARILTVLVTLTPRVPPGDARVRDHTQWLSDVRFELVRADP